MGALREWYFARHGVGHANRPWFYDTIGLDAQSRRLCLSFARRRRRHSHSNTDCDCDCNRNSNSNSNSNSYSYRNSNTWPQVHSHAKAAPDAMAASIARN
jgi:hypothetical protein